MGQVLVLELISSALRLATYINFVDTFSAYFLWILIFSDPDPEEKNIKTSPPFPFSYQYLISTYVNESVIYLFT